MVQDRRPILVPLDGSPFGEHAIPYAASIARRCGAVLHLTHVHLPPIVPSGAETAVLPPAWFEMTRDEKREDRIYVVRNAPMPGRLVEGPGSRQRAGVTRRGTAPAQELRHHPAGEAVPLTRRRRDEDGDASGRRRGGGSPG